MKKPTNMSLRDRMCVVQFHGDKTYVVDTDAFVSWPGWDVSKMPISVEYIKRPAKIERMTAMLDLAQPNAVSTASTTIPGVGYKFLTTSGRDTFDGTYNLVMDFTNLRELEE